MSRLPLVALIGLPNSGKSTLINRITGEKKAITDKIAHTTRDLLYGEDDWNGLTMRFVDTGGLVPRPEDKIQKLIQVKSWQAIAEADLLIWVVDRKQNPDTISDEIIQRVWKSGKPFFIAVNKVDYPNQERSVAEFAHLGADQFINISATTGYGLGDMMDLIVDKLHELGYENQPIADVEFNKEEQPKKGKRVKTVVQNEDGTYSVYYQDSMSSPYNLEDGQEIVSSHESPETIVRDWSKKPIKLVFLGRPNVGKSSLFNAMVGKEIQIVTEIPGTTLSVNDYLLERVKEKPQTRVEDESEDQVSTLKNLVFDFYNVVFDHGEKEFANYLRQTYKLNEAKIETFLYLFDQFLLKEISRQDFWPLFFQHTGIEGTTWEELWAIWRGMVKTIPETEAIIRKYKDLGHKIYYITNINSDAWADRQKDEIFNLFDGGIASCEVDLRKPDPLIYTSLLEKYDLNPAECIFVDDKFENVEAALSQGMQGIVYTMGETNLEQELEKLIAPQSQDDEKEYLQRYILLDTAGIRKAGQRTLGVETFATYRTVAAVNEADVVLMVFDASQPLTHQDQVVAGIATESKKGLVVLLNKSDIVDEVQREKFVRSFQSKFQFLKIDRVIWVSAEKRKKLGEIWDAVDEVIASRSKNIDPAELRKVFNYLMRQKPPQKMTDRKKPVIYDLVFTKQAPPTFELWVRFADTIHWSYTRFLANFLGKQFNFVGGNPIVKIVEKKRMNLVKDKQAIEKKMGN
ncbi:MAG: hypothetical protein OHK0017_02450 [Patescibacteria group bacterium]